MKLDGTLSVHPTDKGARVVYIVHTDLGGAIPAFFARAAQRRSAINIVREARRRAQLPAKSP
jgi:carbon monoxide dehydrogenase subunit G